MGAPQCGTTAPTSPRQLPPWGLGDDGHRRWGGTVRMHSGGASLPPRLPLSPPSPPRRRGDGMGPAAAARRLPPWAMITCPSGCVRGRGGGRGVPTRAAAHAHPFHGHPLPIWATGARRVGQTPTDSRLLKWPHRCRVLSLAGKDRAGPGDRQRPPAASSFATPARASWQLQRDGAVCHNPPGLHARPVQRRPRAAPAHCPHPPPSPTPPLHAAAA